MAIYDEKTALNPQQLQAFGEVVLQMLGGLGGSIVGFPGSVLETIMGRGSPEQMEKYPGLKSYITDVPHTSGQLGALAAEKLAPRSELGQQYAESVGKGGAKLDELLRTVSGAIPSALEGVPGEHPYLANLADQLAYTGLSVVSPTRFARGATSAAKGGFYPAAMAPKLMRADYYGEGFDIPWYGGGKAGRAFQQTKMVGEFFGSKIANFLRPKSAFLSETKGISNTARIELKKLERRMDEFKGGNSKQIYAPTGRTRKQMYDMSVKDYVDQWANIMGQAKIYRPDHPLFKNLDQDLIRNIFPASKTAKMVDAEANPQIIGEGVLNSIIPDGVIKHILSDMQVKLKTGGEDIEFIRKPLEPYTGGKNVRQRAQESKLDNRDGIHYQQNAFSSLVGTDIMGFKDGILQILKEDGIPITKDNIIAKAIELNKNYTGTKINWKHDVALLEREVQRGDGYLSFGNQSRTADRLLATMHHRWVFDPNTGQALMFNFDHLRFGSGIGFMDKIVNLGAKNRFVVVEPYKANMIENILGKKAGVPTEWELTSATEMMPKPQKGTPRVDVVRAAGKKLLEDEPSRAYKAGRYTESYGYPAATIGTRNENREARSLY